MSWSSSTPEPVSKSTIAIDEPHYPDEVQVEQRQQFAVALACAKALAEAVGRPADAVQVSISGHANPDHAPRAGWANEMITITVSAYPAPDADGD